MGLLTPNWLSRHLPLPSTAQVLAGALGMRQEGLGCNARFLYPARGGIDNLPEAILAACADHDMLSVRLSTNFEALDPQDCRIKITTERDWLGWRTLISTIPLPELLDRITTLPLRVREARDNLRSIPSRYGT